MKNIRRSAIFFCLMIFAILFAVKPVNAQEADIVNQNGDVIYRNNDNDSSKAKLNNANGEEISNEASYAWPEAFSSNADTIPFVGFYLRTTNHSDVTGIVVDKIEIYQEEKLILSTTNVTSHSKLGRYYIRNANFKSKLSNSNGDNKVNVIFYKNGVEVARLTDFILKSYSNTIVSNVFSSSVGTSRNEFPLEVSIINASKNSTIDVYYTNSQGEKVATLVGENSATRYYDSISKELTVDLKMIKTSFFDNSENYTNYTANIFVDNVKMNYSRDYNDTIFVNSSTEIHRIYHLSKSPYRYHVEGINLVNANPFTLVLKQNDNVIAEITDIKAKFDSSTYIEYIDEDITKKIKNAKIEMEAILYSNDEEICSFTYFEAPDTPDAVKKLTSMKLESSKATLEIADTFQLKLIGVYSDKSEDDLTNSATYSSSKSSIATVDENGLVTANGIGTAVITAISEDGSKKTTFNLTVAPNLIGLTTIPEAINVEMGKKVTVKVMALYEGGKTKEVSKGATLSIKDNSPIITISKGIVTGVNSGEAVLVVSFGKLSKEIPVKVTKVLTGLTVTKQSNNLKSGETGENIIMATFSDLTQEDVTELCTWKSSNSSIASVDSKGVVTAGSRGKAIVTAALGKFKVNINLSVDPVLESISIMPDRPVIYLGKTQKLKVFATYIGENSKKYDITNSISNDEWIKNNNDVITIAKGVVKANAVGTANISISYQGKTANAEITTKKLLTRLSVTPTSIKSEAGKGINVVVTAKFASGADEIVTEECIWTSKNPSVADIDDNQVIHTLAKGKTQITGIWQNKKVTITVTVN